MPKLDAPLRSSSELLRYISNTAWMLGEKIITLGLGLLATVLLARSLGPDGFGIFNYALSVVGLASVVSHLGLSGIVVKELKSRPDEQFQIINTVITLKWLAATLAFLCLIAGSFLSKSEGGSYLGVIAIIGLILILQPTEVFDLWFQSKVEAKFGALAQVIGGLVGNLLKILVAVLGLTVTYAALAHLTQMLIIAALLYLFYRAKRPKNENFHLSVRGAVPLLKQGAWIFLGSISAVVYLKIDQVMLAWIHGVEEVGQYAAAARLSEAWYFIPSVIMASIFPKLIEKKLQSSDEYYRFMEKLFGLLYLMAMVLILFAFIFSEYVISILYGEAYSASASVLKIHIVASVFVFMRALISKWIIVEELFVFSLISQGLGALVNVILNIILIPQYGTEGAAWATVISYAVAGYFSLLLYRKSRGIFILMSKVMSYGWILLIKNQFSGKGRL